MNVTTTPDNLIPDNMPEWQGKKGQKAMRINLAVSAENAEFLRIVSKDYEVNMTALVNRIIQLFREQNPDILETAISHQKNKAALQSKEANP